MLKVLFYHAFFLLSLNSFLIPAAITQIFNLTVELIISTGIPIKAAKAEIKTHSVALEV